uniref:Uncharacterized protein n=1 Tax=Callorhinchus milii TaxID=7868 RepID=V9L4U5_CALMI
MNSETRNGTFSILNLLLATTETLQKSDTSIEKGDPLPIIIALMCIFLLLATCIIFIALCNPAGLDASRHGPHECMPYHIEDSSEPQLTLWKRFSSLRQSINGFRWDRSISQQHRGLTDRYRREINDLGFVELTKM